MGVKKAVTWLTAQVNTQTVVFLSGGSSPKGFYEELAREQKFHPAAVALIDERFGPLSHTNSNEAMISRTGLISYFARCNIPWYPILQNGLSRQETAMRYEKVIRGLFKKFPKRIAIVSIGEDGHTAGIAPHRDNFHNPLFESASKELLVGTFADSTGPFGERITLTFTALSKMNAYLLWVFGETKKNALIQMLQKGDEAKIPARFYQRKDISPKVLVITDIQL